MGNLYLRHSKKRLWLFIIGCLIFFISIYTFYVSFIYSPIIFGLRDDFKEAVPYQIVPEGIAGIKAEDCAICHREIYEEWKTSYHAKAFTDPFFQAYWKKDKNIWICLNCHTPLVNQQQWLIKGLEGGSIARPIKGKNPYYDPEFQEEGISCAACHVRDGVILGPYRDSVAPHPTRYDSRFKTTEICYTCHQVPGGPFQFYNGGPCATFFEFETNPYAKKGYICQTCHMPSITRPVAVGGPVRKGRQHLWRGGHFPEMVQDAIEIHLASEHFSYRPGDKATFNLTITNSGAGHKIPTGDPDRFFTIEFEIVNSRGTILKSQHHTIGRWIIWWPIILEVYDNRIPPLMSQSYTFTYHVPSEGAEGLYLRYRIRYHIMTETAHTRLKRSYGLTATTPYSFTMEEETSLLLGPWSERELLSLSRGKPSSISHQQFCMKIKE